MAERTLVWSFGFWFGLVTWFLVWFGHLVSGLVWSSGFWFGLVIWFLVWFVHVNRCGLVDQLILVGLVIWFLVGSSGWCVTLWFMPVQVASDASPVKAQIVWNPAGIPDQQPGSFGVQLWLVCHTVVHASAVR